MMLVSSCLPHVLWTSALVIEVLLQNGMYSSAVAVIVECLCRVTMKYLIVHIQILSTRNNIQLKLQLITMVCGEVGTTSSL